MSSINPLPAGLQGPVATPQPLTSPAPVMSPTPIGPGLPPAKIISTAHPDAVRLQSYLDATHKAGYGNIDPAAQIALAGGGINTPGHQGVLDTVTSGLAGAWHSVGHWLSDPATVKPATDTQRVSDHLTNTGLATHSPSQIQDIQSEIQATGFGKDLPLDGIWSADWSSANHQAVLAHNSQPGIGQQSARSMFTHFALSGLLSYAIPLVKSMAVSAVREIGKEVAILASANDNLFTGHLMPQTDPNAMANQVGAAIQSATQLQNGAQKFTPAMFAKQSQVGEDVLHATADVIGMYLTVSSFGTLAKTGGVIGENLLANSSKIADATGSNLLNSAFKMGSDEAYKISRGGKWVMNTIMPQIADEAGAFTRRFAFPKITDNAAMNYLTRMVGIPSADAVAAGYQMARESAATLYKIPAVSAIGSAGGATGLFGFKVGAIGALQSAVGDPQGPQAQALQHLAPISGMLGVMLNVGQLGLHAPFHSLTDLAPIKAQTSAVANNIHAVAQDFLRSSQVLADSDRVAGQFGYDTYAQTVVKGAAANPPVSQAAIDFHKWNDVNQQAALHMAQGQWQELVKAGKADATDTVARNNFVQETGSAIRNSPKDMAVARESYVIQSGLYAKDLHDSIVNHRQDPRFDPTKKIIQQLQKDDVYREGILPYLNHAITPATMNQIQEIDTFIHSPLIGDKMARRTTMSDAQVTDINGAINTVAHGHANLDYQTSGDMRAEATTIYKGIKAYDPSFVIPEKVNKAEAEAGSVNPLTGEPLTSHEIAAGRVKATYDPSSATDAEKVLRVRALDYLHGQNVNTKDLAYTPTVNLADLIMAKSRGQASDVFIPYDAPQELIDGVAKLKAMGGKPVIGTDLGHIFLKPPADMSLLGKEQSTLSHYADKLGLNLAQVQPKIAAAHAYNTAENMVQDWIFKQPAGTLAPWVTASRLMDYLHDMIKPEMNALSSLGFNIAASPAGRFVRPFKGGMWQKEIAKRMAADRTLSLDDAKASIKNELTTASGPQYWTPSQVIKALTAKGDPENGLVKNINNKDVGAPHMSVKQASEMYYSMAKGLRSAPAFVAGVSPFTKMLDSTFGFSNVPAMLPSGRRILDLTSPVMKTMLAARYTTSYRFAFLRVIKSAAKGVSADIPFTMDAHKSMVDMGIDKEAYALRDKLLGKNNESRSVIDYVNQEYSKNDIFNVYNPRAIEARNLWYLNEAAKLDPKNLLPPITLVAPKFTPKFPKSPAWEGGPTLFHGTSTEHIQGNFHGFKADNLFGPGLYATDSAKVAQSYMRKGHGQSPALYSVKWTGKEPPKFINFDSPAPELRTVVTNELKNWDNRIDFSFTEEAMANPKSTGAQIWKAISDDLQSQHESSSLAVEIYDGIQDKLSIAGFNGIEHLGGIRAGKGNELHNVKIFFEDYDNGAVPVSLAKVDIPKPPEPVATPRQIPQLTDAAHAQVLKNLDSIFTYGPRTAAEKSVNAFFFQFSFEKTVVRQLGGHLLDHPASRLGVATAIAIYNSPDGQQIQKWMETNIPLFREVEKFNPFYHGVGLGMFGGILRLPLDVAGTLLKDAVSNLPDNLKRDLFINMLAPKPITGMASAKAAMALFPAMKDLNNIVLGFSTNKGSRNNPGGEIRTSFNTLRWEAGNAIANLTGESGRNPVTFWAPQTHLPDQVQKTRAYQLISQLRTALASTLEVNRNGDNYVVPDSWPVDKGQKITVAIIDDLVHYKYPVYDPTTVGQYVMQRQAATRVQADSFLAKAPDSRPLYDVWVKINDKYQSKLSLPKTDPDYPTDATKKTITELLHKYAGQLAKADPTFAGFYKQYYETKYAPLKGL
jgi:hypothetical protein